MIEKIKDWIRMWELQRNEALEEIHSPIEAGFFKEKCLESLAHQLQDLLTPKGDDEGLLKREKVDALMEKSHKGKPYPYSVEDGMPVAKVQRDLTRRERLPDREKIGDILKRFRGFDKVDLEDYIDQILALCKKGE